MDYFAKLLRPGMIAVSGMHTVERYSQFCSQIYGTQAKPPAAAQNMKVIGGKIQDKGLTRRREIVMNQEPKGALISKCYQRVMKFLIKTVACTQLQIFESILPARLQYGLQISGLEGISGNIEIIVHEFKTPSKPHI